MIEQAAIHLLIPIRFDPACFEKLGEDYRTPSKMRMQELARKGVSDQKENFDYYFRLQPIRETIPLSGSPLIDRMDDPLIKRVVLTGPGRTQIGIYQNEDHPCRLSINQTDFTIGRVRIYFFSFGIGVVQVVLETKEKTEEEIVPLCGLLSSILRKKKFTYEVPIAKGEKEERSVSLYQMLTHLLKMQSYVPLAEYGGYTFNKAYLLAYLTGRMPEEDRALFFDTLRNQRARPLPPASEEISSHTYPAFRHITWVTGDRSLICLGDLDRGDKKNIEFLNKPDGMRMSVSENYATIYAYCIARQLLFLSQVENVREERKKAEGLRILHSLPQERFSVEEHVNNLFDEYLWIRQWDLKRRIGEQETYCTINQQVSFREEWNAEREYQHQRLDQISEHVDTILEIGGESQQDLRYLVEFTQTELPALMRDVQELREEFRKWNQGLDEEGSEHLIRSFIQRVTESIEERALLNNALVERESSKLQELLGEIWPSLRESTRAALISASVLWESCQNIDLDTFDYSGICICTVSALEGEAGRLFFQGMKSYKRSVGEEPSEEEESSKKKQKKNQKKEYFLMGSLVYRFGCSSIDSISDEFYVHRIESEKSVKKREAMRRYLSQITTEPYQSDPLSVFMEPRKDSFLDRFERIRLDYRNKAAHTSVMTREETDRCRELVLGRLENGELRQKGLLARMYETVDFEKLKKLEADT